MSLTTYDSLKLENLTPDHVAVAHDDKLVVDGPILIQPYGETVISGDLITEGVRVAGNLNVTQRLDVEGNLAVRNDVIVDSLSGEGTSPITVDSHGKLSRGKPELQQIFSHYAPSTIIPVNTNPQILLPQDDSEQGSLQIPIEWWDAGRRLTFVNAIEWNKQAGVGSDLTLSVNLSPPAGDPVSLVSIPLSLHALEASLPTSGQGVLDLEIQVGDIWGCGDTLVEIYGTCRFNDTVCLRFDSLVPLQSYGIKVLCQFTNISGSNSVTVLAASATAYEPPPYTSTLNA